MSRWVKICRGCKIEHASDARGLCSSCGSPLAGIDSVEIDDTPVAQASSPENGADLIRCPACGTLTRPLTMCETCNHELPVSAAIAQAHAESGSGSRLEIIAGTQVFECKNGDILGRSGTLASQIFDGIDTVSNRHVLVTQEEGNWFLTVFAGVQNATQLDGEELRRGVAYPLNGAHQLKMSLKCEICLRVSPP